VQDTLGRDRAETIDIIKLRLISDHWDGWYCRLSTIPGNILRDCLALHTINVHRNPLTIEVLREIPEYKIFDERRKAKYSKQVHPPNSQQ